MERPMIEIKDLNFTYPKEERAALFGIDLLVEQGEFVLLCGKSGCGKSTLLKHLKKPLMPEGMRTGEIWIDGISMEELSHREQSQKVGYVLQDPDHQIVTDKVWHELAFGLESMGMEQAEIRLRVAEMASYFGIQHWFHKNVTELSGGQKQILNLASVMAMHPDILILDEPTSQLDPIAAADFLETIAKINRELGTTIILTEHRLEEAMAMAGRVIVMEEGQVICQGTPKEIGMYLAKHENDMFHAMPVPMQIYHQIPEGECPITVAEGRRWIEEQCAKKNVRNKVQEKEEKEAKNPILECKEVWFRYERNLPDVIKGLHMQIYEGEFFCLLGGNGTGKTTLLSLISRMLTPYRGKILLKGKKLGTYSTKELYREQIGVLPQNPQTLFVKATVEEELYEMLGGKRERMNEEYHLDMEKKTVVEGMAEVMELTKLLHRHPYDLSGGEQQKLALAKILLLRPKILLMDEPTKGMDGYFKEEFARLIEEIKKQGITIFMISHDIEFCANYADRCGLFFDGQLITSGTPKEFFTGNHFYTTAANRMARKHFPYVVTGKDVVECLKD